MDTVQIKTKDEAIDWIHNRLKLGIKPGLSRMEWMLERLENPQHHLRYVHVAGTNGKGSTVSYISQVLRKSGYTVGTFTSPYLIDFTNRIQVNGQDITGSDLVDIVNQIIPLNEELERTGLGGLSEFEAITLIAILYFSKKAHPDIVIWETGLGGRLDSTNVVYPLVSVITNIGYDHMEYLGNTLQEIAMEKAGIIKQGVPVVTGVEDESAKTVIQEVANSNRSNLYQLGEHFSILKNTIHQNGSVFDFKDMFFTMPDIEISLVGPHQVKNAALALMTLEILRQYYAFNIEEDAFYTGMKATNWPGRFETILEAPQVVLDGAHNPEGSKSLAETIQLLDYKRLIMVTGILQDKAIQEFYQPLVAITDEMIITKPDYPRAANPEDVVEMIQSIGGVKRVRVIEDWKEAIQSALEEADPDDLVVMTGSLYMISDMRKYLLEHYKKN